VFVDLGRQPVPGLFRNHPQHRPEADIPRAIIRSPRRQWRA